MKTIDYRRTLRLRVRCYCVTIVTNGIPTCCVGVCSTRARVGQGRGGNDAATTTTRRYRDSCVKTKTALKNVGTRLRVKNDRTFIIFVRCMMLYVVKKKKKTRSDEPRAE